jgi:PEP-CTERM putative exosortase interaction domain
MRYIVLSILLLLTFSFPIFANSIDPFTVCDGTVNGYPHQDLAFRFTTVNALSLAGWNSYPTPIIEGQLFTGHLDHFFPVYMINGIWDFVNPKPLAHMELFFDPIALMGMSIFDPGVAGSSVTERFQMITRWSGTEFVSFGTITAGWFSRESPNFGFSYIQATFEAPEPTTLFLLAIGLLLLFIMRRLIVYRPSS